MSRGDPAACPATAAALATYASAHVTSQHQQPNVVTDDGDPVYCSEPMPDAICVSGRVAAGVFPTLPCSAACRASCLAGDSAFAGFPAKRLSRVQGDAGAAGSCTQNVFRFLRRVFKLLFPGEAAVQGRNRRSGFLAMMGLLDSPCMCASSGFSVP